MRRAWLTLLVLAAPGALVANENGFPPTVGSAFGMSGFVDDGGIRANGMGLDRFQGYSAIALFQDWNAGLVAPPRQVQAPQDEPAAPAAPATYTVARGDSLWEIAEKLCGDGNRWRELHEANRDRVPNPNRLEVGEELVNPCGGQAAPRTDVPAAGAGSPGDATAGDPPGTPGVETSSGGGDVPLPDRRPDPPPPGDEGFGTGFVTHRPLPKGSHSLYRNYWKKRGKRRHKGIDMPAPAGTPISSVADGVVTAAYKSDTYGWVVFIKHANGMESRYAHMARRPAVRQGQRVSGGQYLGPVGSTGRSTGNHLHFEIRKHGAPVNPLHYCNY